MPHFFVEWDQVCLPLQHKRIVLKIESEPVPPLGSIFLASLERFKASLYFGKNREQFTTKKIHKIANASLTPFIVYTHNDALFFTYLSYSTRNLVDILSLPNACSQPHICWDNRECEVKKHLPGNFEVWKEGFITLPVPTTFTLQVTLHWLYSPSADLTASKLADERIWNSLEVTEVRIGGQEKGSVPAIFLPC